MLIVTKNSHLVLKPLLSQDLEEPLEVLEVLEALAALEALEEVVHCFLLERLP